MRSCLLPFWQMVHCTEPLCFSESTVLGLFLMHSTQNEWGQTQDIKSTSWDQTPREGTLMARSGKNFVVPLVRSLETTEHSATLVLFAVIGMVDTKENMCFHFCDTYFHFITFVNFLSSKLPQFWSLCETSHHCSHVLVTVAEEKLR